MRRVVANGLGLLALLLAGCGFHLRGPVELAPDLRVIYIQSQLAIGSPPGELSRKLPVVLARNGVTVTRDPAQATAVLTILNEGGGRRTMAADRSDIKREYALVYSAVYDVKRPGGQVLIGAEGVSANRAVLFDENRVLGFESARDSLTDSMAEDMAWQILRRLQAFKP